MIDLQTQSVPCYTLSMALSKEKRDEKVSAKIPATVKSQILALTSEHDRTESYVVLSLIERGLAAYQRDGLLKEPQATEGRVTPSKTGHKHAEVEYREFNLPEKQSKRDKNQRKISNG